MSVRRDPVDRWIGRVAVVLMVAVSLQPVAAAQDGPVSLDEIEQWILTGRYDEAAEQLDARADEGDDPRALRLRVEALISIGRYDDADAAFEGKDGAALGLGVLRGRVALLRGDRETAGRSFEEA
ncbi:MAG: hypothetical protein J4F98_16675, partial [Acidobacteria bacterium]|nr:hypothetical protein [Acidobacteriota bacterium]